MDPSSGNPAVTCYYNLQSQESIRKLSCNTVRRRLETQNDINDREPLRRFRSGSFCNTIPSFSGSLIDLLLFQQGNRFCANAQKFLVVRGNQNNLILSDFSKVFNEFAPTFTVER